jgi:hypothetical protein
MFFVFLVTSSIFVGNTLAANVVISNGRIEFGQGAAQYKACSGSNSLAVKQGAQFTDGVFKLKSIEISNIPVECYGLNLIVSILKPGADGTGDLATLFGSVTRLRILDSSGTFYTSQSDSASVTLLSTKNSGTNTDTVLITFTTPTVLMTDIGTLGVESSSNLITLPCGSGGVCQVGDIGPGGGAIILYTDDTFSAPGSPCDLECRGIEMDQSYVGNYIDRWAETAGGADGVNRSGTVGRGSTGLGAGYANTKRAMTSANGSNNGITRDGAMGYCWNKVRTSATDRWYLPSVMEYAYIFKQVRDNAAFRNKFPGYPAATDYYSSEEAWTGWNAGYQALWNADGPPSGITFQNSGGSEATTHALAVNPARANYSMVDTDFQGFEMLRVFSHAKSSGYAVLCLKAFK